VWEQGFGLDISDAWMNKAMKKLTCITGSIPIVFNRKNER